MDKTELIPHFDEQLFIPALQGRSKDSILEEMVGRFVESGFVRNRAIVLEMVRRREQLGSTGIGHGIAIPHGRTTATPELKIAYGYSTRGIAWEAIDKKPVQMIFMVLAPPQEENNRYLPVLGRLVEILSNAGERGKLKAINDFAEFINILKG